MGSPSRGLLSRRAACVDVIWPHCLILGTEGKTGRSFSFKHFFCWRHWVFVTENGLLSLAESALLAGVASPVAEYGLQRTWAQDSRCTRFTAPRPVGPSQTRDGICASCVGRRILQSLDHQESRGFSLFLPQESHPEPAPRSHSRLTYCLEGPQTHHDL